METLNQHTTQELAPVPEHYPQDVSVEEAARVRNEEVRLLAGGYEPKDINYHALLDMSNAHQEGRQGGTWITAAKVERPKPPTQSPTMLRRLGGMVKKFVATPDAVTPVAEAASEPTPAESTSHYPIDFSAEEVSKVRSKEVGLFASGYTPEDINYHEILAQENGDSKGGIVAAKVPKVQPPRSK